MAFLMSEMVKYNCSFSITFFVFIEVETFALVFGA